LQVKRHCELLQSGVALAGAVQTLPQMPQFDVLLVRSTHELLQFVSPGSQIALQIPPLQTWPVQTMGHIPQWSLSDFKSTHSPLQSV
jgi:hypothetical protein